MSEEQQTTTTIVEAPPSEIKVIKVEDGKATVRDADSRVIVVKRLSALAFYDLSKVIPDEAKASAVDLATLAASVLSVNTTKFGPIKNESDIRFVLQTLDFEGLAAVSAGLGHLSRQTPKEIEIAKN